ncbi:spliceosome-associated CWC15 family protein [Actinomadura litoris]|uniref:spliceosome-associated CWC15 family protein n=1 Tax=Actinomadura litoris TaxID=2678616 RepID=UPI001FA804CC|nr:spliceosome-associated CWC15 family protein [Actinomadura litoris]
MKELIAPLAWIGIIAFLVWGVRKIRRERAAQHAAREALRQQAVAELRRFDGQDGHLARVEQVYQRARTGAKAIIVWDANGTSQDAWFHDWPGIPTGAYLLLAGTTGYGPHNHNPNVYYVHPDQVLTVI